MRCCHGGEVRRPCHQQGPWGSLGGGKADGRKDPGQDGPSRGPAHPLRPERLRRGGTQQAPLLGACGGNERTEGRSRLGEAWAEGKHGPPGREPEDPRPCVQGLSGAGGAWDQRVTCCARKTLTPSLTRRLLFFFLLSLRPQMCPYTSKESNL